MMNLNDGLKSIGTPPNGQKVAVVTGGANGIGKCIAEEFRKQGVKVYVTDKAAGDHYVGDISDKGVLEAFAEKVILENGGIDYLINNALPLMIGRRRKELAARLHFRPVRGGEGAILYG